MAAYLAGAWNGTGWLSDTKLVSLRIESPKPLDISPKEPAVCPGWQADEATQTGCGAICMAAIWASGTAAQPDRVSAKAHAMTGEALEECRYSIGGLHTREPNGER